MEPTSKSGLTITARRNQIVKMTLPDGTTIFIKAFKHGNDVRINIIAPDKVSIKRIEDPRVQ